MQYVIERYHYLMTAAGFVGTVPQWNELSAQILTSLANDDVAGANGYICDLRANVIAQAEITDHQFSPYHRDEFNDLVDAKLFEY